MVGHGSLVLKRWCRLMQINWRDFPGQQQGRPDTMVSLLRSNRWPRGLPHNGQMDGQHQADGAAGTTRELRLEPARHARRGKHHMRHIRTSYQGVGIAGCDNRQPGAMLHGGYATIVSYQKANRGNEVPAVDTWQSTARHHQAFFGRPAQSARAGAAMAY